MSSTVAQLLHNFFFDFFNKFIDFLQVAFQITAGHSDPNACHYPLIFSPKSATVFTSTVSLPYKSNSFGEFWWEFHSWA